MTVKPAIETARLWLRPWIDADLAPFAAMGRDPRVMAHFPALVDEAQSKATAVRAMNHIGEHGFGFWAVERKSDRQFLGFCGLKTVSFPCPIAGEIEIGWRLAHAHWGQGYAHEAAQASLDHGFGVLGLAQITSFTVPDNTRSWGLMERLGMERRSDLDFDHPELPPGHRLRPHIVYVKTP
ncbi:GNAT family N-acetyltransferase [Sandarakinorhabdus oryzae]|uniref:GNAT family N-acetyltransferase n=1 Tax=Sandarakinorhabdus oryzae TaxID=2675220 RepID=UPI0012E28556|nr:GNAT family N-acetyltransferase [Sandarakinorhabdus oryzae]